MPDLVGRRPADAIVQEAVAVRGHRDEIDVLRLRRAHQLRRRIAHRQRRLDLEPLGRELDAERLEVDVIGNRLIGV